MRKSAAILALLIATTFFAGPWQTANAALSAVDQGPYLAYYGFYPAWYQDSNGLQLELCLSKAISPNVQPPDPAAFMCGGLLPAPPFDPNLPIVFPLNWSDENFWFMGDAAMTVGGNDMLLITGLEAAFGTGPVLNGDQVSFARVRIRIDVPSPGGDYVVTTPYGVFSKVDYPNDFGGVAPGRRAINFTEDIGIGAPGIDFSGALAGKIGPFLQAAAAPGGAPTPTVIGTETFIGDPNIDQFVTGSPIGRNYFRVEGPGIGTDPNFPCDSDPAPADAANCVETKLFVVSGKIWNGVLPTSVNVERSTYSRTSQGLSQVDVFATSPATATLSFRDALDDTLPGITIAPMTSDDSGKFYGNAPIAPPPWVIVTAGPTPPALSPPATQLASQVVDVVKIHQARYSKTDRTLVIEASSSDELVIPTLRVVDLPGTLQIVSGTTTQQLVVNGVVEPPATVTVKSSAGGADTEPVAVVEVANANPIAVNDSREMLQGTAQLVIDVLTNDSDPDDPQNLNPLTVANLTQPGAGTGSATTDGTSVTYTPPDATFTGTATFTYQAQDSRGGLSNVATVTVTVRLPNRNPVANPDTATTPEDTPVTIPVLANDTDPDGNPLTLTAVSNAVNGTAVISGASVVFTPSPNFNGNAGFSYTVSDGQGGSAPGTVTVTVTPVNDPPVANADTATTAEDTPLFIPLAALLVNDTDIDGGALSVTAVSNPVNGAVVINGANAVFTPALNFNGAARFSYTISDGNGGTATATVSVTVTAVNDAPVAVNDAATAASGVAATIPVLANDTDVDGPVLVVGTITQGANGSVVNNGTNVTYTPNAGFTGQDTFTYQASDGSILSNVATVTVTVTAVALDLDIQQFQTTNNVRVGRGESVAITLRVRNQSAVNVGAPARVVGTLNGNVIYDRSLTVNDPPGGGTTSFNFPAFTPNAQQVGTINWVATINDTNPDVDQATATSRIRP